MVEVALVTSPSNAQPERYFSKVTWLKIYQKNKETIWVNLSGTATVFSLYFINRCTVDSSNYGSLGAGRRTRLIAENLDSLIAIQCLGGSVQHDIAAKSHSAAFWDQFINWDRVGIISPIEWVIMWDERWKWTSWPKLISFRPRDIGQLFSTQIWNLHVVHPSWIQISDSPKIFIKYSSEIFGNVQKYS